MVIMASFVEQLSTVTVEIFLSIFQSIIHSSKVSQRTSFVCGHGT
ncbi:hypothetical protein LOK49_LG11G01030 [Camellia lanceoleosa]|uniref:Uncharacterized protein n=1 Tax=Camellia lanceoleosa TaxID=1840588 RepID=A0ACC0G4Z4_9ERIC|nr:hypothetical protein LOK49_LG11G01030 [Camellia lanceoleosa]